MYSQMSLSNDKIFNLEMRLKNSDELIKMLLKDNIKLDMIIGAIAAPDLSDSFKIDVIKDILKSEVEL